jgi:protein-tyrosine phosphatase
MAGLVDIHSHILPEVDDGATSMEMALEMLRRGLAEGIETAVLTPHLKPGDVPTKKRCTKSVLPRLKKQWNGRICP